jgi:hypothetical protein
MIDMPTVVIFRRVSGELDIFQPPIPGKVQIVFVEVVHQLDQPIKNPQKLRFVVNPCNTASSPSLIIASLHPPWFPRQIEIQNFLDLILAERPVHPSVGV